MTSQFSDMTSMPNFFDVVLFLLSNLVTGPTGGGMRGVKKEIKHLQNMFHHTNDFPKAVIQNDIFQKLYLSYLFILQKINKMFLRVIYLPSHLRGKEEKEHFEY